MTEDEIMTGPGCLTLVGQHSLQLLHSQSSLVGPPGVRRTPGVSANKNAHRACEPMAAGGEDLGADVLMSRPGIEPGACGLKVRLSNRPFAEDNGTTSTSRPSDRNKAD